MPIYLKDASGTGFTPVSATNPVPVTITAGDVGDVDGPASATDNALARFDGATGKIIQNGIVTESDYTGQLNGPAAQSTTTAVGSAFTNQPANDGVEVVSDDAGDTTQTVTIIGTTNGADTVVVETVTLTGTTAVATVKTDWGVILAVKKSATTLGTVTVREASGDATITAGLTAAVLSVGVNTVTNTAAYNRTVSAVSDGATTKQIGFKGTNSAGTVIYDSQALTGTTAALSNSSFLTLTEIYTGDVESGRTETVTSDSTWTLSSGGAVMLSGGIASTPISGSPGSFTTLAASGLITSTKTTGGTFIQNTSAGSNDSYLRMVNTSGDIGIGTEGAAGGAVLPGTPAYAQAIFYKTGKGLYVGSTGVVTATTDTGFAITGTVSTTDPAGGAGPAWKLGVAASVSPTSPNRTLRVDIGGTSYYIAAKLTND